MKILTRHRKKRPVKLPSIRRTLNMKQQDVIMDILIGTYNVIVVKSDVLCFGFARASEAICDCERQSCLIRRCYRGSSVADLLHRWVVSQTLVRSSPPPSNDA